MKNFRHGFLLMIGLLLVFGTASAAYSQNNRIPKNMGVLSVKSSPASYPVRVNGEVLGMSGVGTGAEFVLQPGRYLVEVEGPNNQVYRKELDIRRREKNCICLNVVENVKTRACPYNIVVDADDRVLEGDIVTFHARNLVTEGAIPVNYKWTVSGGTITSGLGTDTITVNTSGLGGQTITAFLDVTDDVYGSTCMQKNQVSTEVGELPEPPQPFPCDSFESKSRDDDKARFDNCVLRLQEIPNAQIYVIMYQGTAKGSISVDRLSKQSLDYFVRSRGVPPNQIVMTRGGTRERTTVEVWIVPPGAQPPVPR